jgi:hypothetical protein
LREVSRSDGVCRGAVDFFCRELLVRATTRLNPLPVGERKWLGIQFLRFNDLYAKRNMAGVLSVIEQWIEEHTPDPSQEGNKF